MRKLSVNVSWIVVVAATLIAWGSASVAQAQETKLVAHVPFAFIVGSSEMPAGEYVVKSTSDDDNSVLAIESADGRRFANTLTIPTSADDGTGQSQLVFDKVGSRYFLARVMAAGTEERDLLLKPAALEREVSVNLSGR